MSAFIIFSAEFLILFNDFVILSLVVSKEILKN